MSALVETGDGARCVQMDPRVRAEKNARTGIGMADAWTIRPADPDVLERQVSVIRSDVSAAAITAELGETAPPPPDGLMGNPYLVFITEADMDAVRAVMGAGLPAEMAMAIVGVVVLPAAVQTDDGARRVVRGLMRMVAVGQLPTTGDAYDVGKAWMRASAGLVEGLSMTIPAPREE